MKSLKSLSDNSLLNRLNQLVKKEHNLTCEILLHLIEVENRKIYRSLGYSSLFVYCVDALGYAESSAQRKICAARAIRKCPEAYQYLRDDRVNLSTLSIAWKYITPNLLDEIRDKSQRQVFTIVARFEPRIKHPDNTRPVMVKQLVDAPRESQPARALNGSCVLALAAPEESKLGENHHRSGGKNPCSVEESTPELKMDTVKRCTTSYKYERVVMHQVNCLVDDGVMEMLNRCKELMSGRFPTGIDYNTLIQELAIEWLKKHDPVQRAERRDERKQKSTPKAQEPVETSRYISPATRDAVYNRDKGRCTYVGSNGKRCESIWDLEIHHDEVSFAMGGGHNINNLRLLCAAHNKLESERVYGVRHQEKYVKKRK